MTTETRFTPGPWFAHDDHPTHACYHIDQADMWALGEVATVYSPGEEMADANAHLIAAGPDLYEALEMVLEMLDIGGFGKDAAIDAARAAIAKARGES